MTAGSNRPLADSRCSVRAGELDTGVRRRGRGRAHGLGATVCALSVALFVLGAAPIVSAGAVDRFFGDFRGISGKASRALQENEMGFRRFYMRRGHVFHQIVKNALPAPVSRKIIPDSVEFEMHGCRFFV